MGFLSRKTTPEDGAEQAGVAQIAQPQPVDPNPPHMAAEEEPVEHLPPPSPPEPDGEEIKVSENGGALDDAPEVGSALVPDEVVPEPEEPRRMKPSEIIAPTRREMAVAPG